MTNRWNPVLVIAMGLGLVACGGGSGSPTTPTSTFQPQANRNPTITSMQASPAFGIAGITQFNFSSSASDPDGDALTYKWDFADGATRDGAAVAYNYGNVFGSSVVRLTVTDGKGGTASDTRPVTVGNLGGNWSGTLDHFPLTMTLSQDRSGNVTGIWTLPGTGISGQLDPAAFNRIEANAHLVLRCKVTAGGGPFGFSDFTLDGQMNTTDGNRLNGGVRGSGFGGEPFVLNRQ